MCLEVMVIIKTSQFLIWLKLYLGCTHYTLPYNNGGVLWFHIVCLCVSPCVCPSICCTSVHPYFLFQTITINGFSPNLIYALILWRSGLGLPMGKFHQFLTVISPPQDNGRALSFHVLLSMQQRQLQECFISPLPVCHQCSLQAYLLPIHPSVLPLSVVSSW